MFDNQVIHTEHRDVIHDCSYDYYGQVKTKEAEKLLQTSDLLTIFSEWRHALQIKPSKFGSRTRRGNGLSHQVGRHIQVQFGVYLGDTLNSDR